MAGEDGASTEASPPGSSARAPLHAIVAPPEKRQCIESLSVASHNAAGSGQNLIPVAQLSDVKDESMAHEGTNSGVISVDDSAEGNLPHDITKQGIAAIQKSAPVPPLIANELRKLGEELVRKIAALQKANSRNEELTQQISEFSEGRVPKGLPEYRGPTPSVAML